MKQFLFSAALVVGATLGFSQVAWPAARVETVSGDVRLADAKTDARVQQGQKIDTGATVRSASGSNAVLRFDDGQVVVLGENTVFKIADYSYEAAKPQSDRSVLELVKGALRFISGAISKRNQDAVKVQTATATIGIRGTDFMAATGSLAVAVGQGMVSVTSGAGSVSFAAGQMAFVPSSAALPAAVTAAQLPASAAAAFGQLGAVPVAGVPAVSSGASGYGAASGGAATGATAGTVAGVSTGTAVAIGAAVVGVAAVATNNDNNTSASHTVSNH